MNSFKELIDALGVRALSEAFGVAESHIRTMRARDSIPPVYWHDLVKLTGSVPFETLADWRDRALRQRKAEKAQSQAIAE